MFTRFPYTLLFLVSGIMSAREYHVSPTGDDTYSGTSAAPFRTIAAAAAVAQPGDTITVREGIYRERVDPPRGGASHDQRITYRAAEGETVVIKGSERIADWSHVQDDTWKARVPNAFFGDHNPYNTEIAGDWFKPIGGKDRSYHTGSVYLDGHWLRESPNKEAVLAPAGESSLWFASVEAKTTTLYAQFPNANPNEALVEINVREAVVYPSRPGVNYITVRGFTLEQAAPNWAPPTAEQVGLIGTHWSKGWIIEGNTIRYSSCTGLTLGKYGDAYDNTGETAKGYIATIRRALKKGWNRETIGSHIVRDNRISHCEQAGIVGSMGGAFSLIEGNRIHDINLRGMLGGHEMAGIKLHGPIDTLIRGNLIYRCGGRGGIWLDWMSQGTRVTQNLLHGNPGRDLFMEVNHGPFLIDRNIFLSDEAILDWSQGGAYVHNLIAGGVRLKHERKRATPYFTPHSTRGMTLAGFEKGDERYLNNWFVGTANLDGYAPGASLLAEGNLFQPSAKVRIERTEAGFRINLPRQSKQPDEPARQIVTSQRLGSAGASGARFTQPTGHDYTLERDFFADSWATNPEPGPFGAETLNRSIRTITVQGKTVLFSFQ